ncbi:acyltransferase [Shewanella algae]|uniref:acyltransferase n=1 Tax=Shewanella algae TaxID=38313 RepID=UPI0030061649
MLCSFGVFFYLLFRFCNLRFIQGVAVIDYQTLFSSVVFGIPYYHMWFLYAIFFMYFFAPHLARIFKYSSKQSVTSLVLGMFSISILYTLFIHVRGGDDLIPIFVKFLIYIPFFVLGGFLRLYNFDVNVRWWLLVYITSVFFTMLGAYFLNLSYFYNGLSLTVVPMSLAVFLLAKKYSLIIFGGYNRVVSDATFGIYLVHPIFLSFFVYLLKKYDILSRVFGEYGIVGIPVITLLVFFTSFLFVLILKRFYFFNRIV